jgi:hypothetical protein
LGTLKLELTESDAVERVRRIELAWPAWKVALGEHPRAISDCETARKTPPITALRSA